ncbi:M24 family metallopeptidase [Cohnella zeiphila]|uniref:Aminopeptidase P family protein n=1 Tax=Cohnella zeiphila TaxID=2761120 RepID=A0A7X0STC0_9BACL|nr:Xaa-Pro peptidase family protein [Cohnella zeiphila]MBB6735626.1 aminopeptidase P family protein [Cohnella zeiphila]
MGNAYAERRNRLLGRMAERGIDAALIVSPTSIYYLTGFLSDPHERFLALLLDARKNAEALFVPLLDAESARRNGTVADIVPLSDTEDPYARLSGALSASAAAVGVEKNVLTLDRAERIARLVPNAALVDLTPELESMRVRKTAEEIAKVQAAVDLIEKVVAHAAERAAVGMTELDLTAELEYQMKRLGADRPSFESIVLTGSRTALPHGVPETVPIREGDFVLIDIGAQVNGYCSDITRTFLMGEGTKEQERIYETVLAANRAGIAAARAGTAASEVDRAARDVIAAAGYGDFFTHRVGHGFGLDIHEFPSLHGANPALLESGMLFTVEPGIYVPELGGVRIEDDVYVQEDGSVRVLTSYPKSLTRLG